MVYFWMKVTRQIHRIQPRIKVLLPYKTKSLFLRHWNVWTRTSFPVEKKTKQMSVYFGFFDLVSEWFLIRKPGSKPIRFKPITNQILNSENSWCGHTRFPALGVGHVNLLWSLIGGYCCLYLTWSDWPLSVINLALGLLHSIENSSNNAERILAFHLPTETCFHEV